MTDMPAEATANLVQAHGHSPDVVLRSLVDLFATQAILPCRVHVASHHAFAWLQPLR